MTGILAAATETSSSGLGQVFLIVVVLVVAAFIFLLFRALWRIGSRKP